MFIHARDKLIFLAAGFHESFLPAQGKFFKRFQTIADKSRADHTAEFFTPSPGKSRKRKSVYGVSQGFRPRRLWKEISYCSLCRPSCATTNSVVRKHWCR